VLHWQRNVIFPLNPTRGERDCSLWNDLLNGDDAATGFAVNLPVHVKTQIHFFEFAMKRDSDPSP